MPLSTLLLWSLLTAPLHSAPPEPCSPFPTTGHRRKIGQGSGKQKRAVREAYADARSRMLQESTVGFSEVRRDALDSHIVDLGHHFESRQACAAVEVEKRWVDAFEGEALQYEADIETLAAAIARRVGDGLLQIDRPTWALSGCVAKNAGPTLTVALRNALAAQPGGLRLVPSGSNSPSATRLRLELAAETQGVRLSAALYRAGGADTPLSGFQFPLDLFNITPNEVGACPSDANLGLQHGQRAGSVSVALELPTSDGFVCEGEELSLSLRSSQPVHARVFSVYGDRTLAIWQGTVDGRQSLGTFRALLDGDSDEKIVVIAADSKAALGDFAGTPGFCRMPKPLDAAQYPISAAVVAETYSIWPAGSRDCGIVDDIDDALEDVQAALENILPCP